MSFDWDNYLHLAKYLVRNITDPGLTEAGYRSAASRAYYSVFHPIKLLASNNGFTLTKKRSIHQQLIKFYQNHTDIVYRRKGIKLQRLWENRKECDYEDRITTQNYKALTHQSIRYANELLNWSRNELK